MEIMNQWPQSFFSFENKRESELWAELKEGNLGAFDFIFRKYVRLLYNYGHRATVNHELLEDCVQDLFAELWEKRETLPEVNFIKPYLLKIFTRKLHKKRELENKLLNRFGLQEDYYFEIVFSHEHHLIKEQNAQDQTKRLNAALRQLTTRQKQVIYLKYFENLKYQEIADIMAISIESIYKLVNKAMQVIKHCLSSLTLFLIIF